VKKFESKKNGLLSVNGRAAEFPLTPALSLGEREDHSQSLMQQRFMVPMRSQKRHEPFHERPKKDARQQEGPLTLLWGKLSSAENRLVLLFFFH